LVEGRVSYPALTYLLMSVGMTPGIPQPNKRIELDKLKQSDLKANLPEIVDQTLEPQAEGQIFE